MLTYNQKRRIRQRAKKAVQASYEHHMSKKYLCSRISDKTVLQYAKYLLGRGKDYDTHMLVYPLLCEHEAMFFSDILKDTELRKCFIQNQLDIVKHNRYTRMDSWAMYRDSLKSKARKWDMFQRRIPTVKKQILQYMMRMDCLTANRS